MENAKNLPRPNRITISVSDQTLDILDRYRHLMGISRGKLIDSWVLESLAAHEAVLSQIESVLKAKK